MSRTLKVNSSRFKAALFRYASHARRLPDTVVNGQMSLHVRDVVRITPPNSNYRMARGAGEARIRKDLGGIMRSSRSPQAEDPAEVHRMYRSRSTGRVNSRLPLRLRRRVRNLKTYRAKVLSRVGSLAAGWMPAARLFGRDLPSWITRHGEGRGAASVRWTGGRVRIVISNRVFFARNVRGLEARVQHATMNRARQLEKQTAQFLFRDAPRLAGLRVAA